MSQHEIRVGRLVTVTQDEYPALGALFVQLWDGESVVARVYGNTHDELNQRIAMLLPEQEKQDQANIEDLPAEEVKTPAELRAEGRPYCPRCYTLGHVHRKDCLHRNEGMAKHVAQQATKMVEVSEHGEGQENDCPECGAEAGSSCSSDEGIEYGRKVHEARQSQAQQPASQWISVDERLPDGDRFVDVFVKSRSNLAYGTRFTEFRFINGMFDVSSLPSACYVSHWMPLPPAPEGGDK